ncbi:Methyl-accepting chemotaxis protein III MCP-III; Ribose and galactose chemoreceptor protein [Salmonella enterica subsp. arizonae]|uniref:Methyl-accepting chemotaxis protein III MCP-III Ribose and galactose chemoreceptor protein n=1 Tax=Salmonella enterica subsp. arizonae TaxID=59203 RepID=A0A379S6M5_SALER|nr:Methyl-accepting chemotaxis protein III MCP-III; Ribose and galactose chemoreceptor protein [Salmonella enterica subsp. arizonae]
MGNTFSMQASHKLGFLHHIRLVPLFSSILGGILLLFALSAGLAGYFLLQADRDQRDVTDEIQVRMGLSNSANHLRTARINMIHAGAASRIAEMDEMKANIAAAETWIKQSQDGFNAYMSRAVKTPADDALDNELNTCYTAYINGLQTMLKFAKNGMFEAIINHENEQAKQLDAAYNHVLLKAIKLRTERARLLSEQAYQRNPAWYDGYDWRVYVSAGVDVNDLYSAASYGDPTITAGRITYRTHCGGRFDHG